MGTNPTAISVVEYRNETPSIFEWYGVRYYVKRSARILNPIPVPGRPRFGAVQLIKVLTRSGMPDFTMFEHDGKWYVFAMTPSLTKEK